MPRKHQGQTVSDTTSMTTRRRSLPAEEEPALVTDAAIFVCVVSPGPRILKIKKIKIQSFVDIFGRRVVALVVAGP